MKKLFVFLVLFNLIISNLKSQNDITYTLGIYETLSYGEYSTTGRFFLQIFDNNQKIFSLESSPSYYGRDEKIVYTYYVQEPFMELVDNTEKPITSYINEYNMNDFIDTVFSKVKVILRKNKEAPFDLNIEKRTISSKLINIFQNDTMENIIIGTCDWDLEKIEPIYWGLTFIPEEAIYKTYQDNELLEQLKYTYSSKEYNRQTFEWNNDSTEQIYRLFDKYNKLIHKSINVYNSERKFIGHYSIDKYTSEKTTYKQKKYPSDLITEEIFYKGEEPIKKTVNETNEYGDIIKMTLYEKHDFLGDKTLKITEKRVIKYEYSTDGQKLRYTFFNEDNLPLTSVKYIYGKL